MLENLKRKSYPWLFFERKEGFGVLKLQGKNWQQLITSLTNYIIARGIL